MVVDWQTVVDGGGTRELWNGRAGGTQGYETEEGATSGVLLETKQHFNLNNGSS